MTVRLCFTGSVAPTAADPDTGHLRLVDRLLEGAPAGAADGVGADLVLLAYGRADRYGHQTVASYLNMRTGGAAHSFALSGQGVGSPFAALRVADSYHRTGRSRRALIGIVECSQSGAPADSAVLLSLAEGPGFGLAEPVLSGSPRELADRLAAMPADALTVLGAAAGVPARTEVLRADPAAACTGVWQELARNWARWRETYSAVALCDVDPVTGTGHVAVLAG